MTVSGQVHSSTLLHASDMEAGETAQHTRNISQFQTIQQLVHVAAITALSGVLAGIFLGGILHTQRCRW